MDGHPLLSPLQYGAHQQTGQQLENWIDTPSAIGDGCPIRPCTLKFRNLGAWQLLTLPCKSSPRHRSPDIGEVLPLPNKTVDIPHMIREQAEKAGLRKFSDSEVKKVVAAERPLGGNPTANWTNYMECCLVPGAIFIDQMFRKSGFYASNIFKAIYEEYFVLEGLGNVFVIDAPQEMLEFIKNQVYPRNQLRWPDSVQRSWVNGTPVFEELLGTQVGRMVARLVLGSFERGSRRISRIVTWEEIGRLQMRFDIDRVPKKARPRLAS